MSDDNQKLLQEELCPADLLAGQEEAFANDIERLHQRIGEFVSAVCPACQTSGNEKVFDKYGFSYDVCASCGTIYMNPRPSIEVMSDYYQNSENYAFWAKHIFPASEANRREKVYGPWFERVVGFCDRHNVQKGTLLEVGPGFGTFAQLATQSGEFDRVVGIEPTPEMAEACRERGVEVIQKRVEDARDEGINPDVVVSFEVIEHLFEPKVFIEQCAELLPTNGLLILSCPNGKGFDVVELGPLSLAVDAEHVNLFNPESLSRLLNSCGFEVLEVTTPGRLDAEQVREAVLKDDLELSPFLRTVLIDEWEEKGWPFQQFLAENGLSSHMWVAARKI